MRIPIQNLRITLTALLWAASFLVQPLTGLAQTANQVLSLDGNGDYVTVPSASDLQNPAEFTVEAWIRPQNANQCQYLVKGDNGSSNSQRSYDLAWGFVAGGKPNIVFELFLGTATYAYVMAPIAETNWTHIAVTYESTGGLLQLYTNGILAGATNRNENGTQPLAGLTVRQTVFPLNIGGQPMIPGVQYTGGFAAGYMDEVRIWNKARTQTEIENRRFCRLSGKESYLAGYWNFDDGTATDLTGHGHSGTFAGNAQATPIVGGDAVHAGVCGTTVSIRVSQIELCWDTLTNNWYQLQYQSTLTTNQWVPFMPNWVAGDGNRFCTNDAVLADQVQRYYRLASTNAPPQ